MKLPDYKVSTTTNSRQGLNNLVYPQQGNYKKREGKRRFKPWHRYLIMLMEQFTYCLKQLNDGQLTVSSGTLENGEINMPLNVFLLKQMNFFSSLFSVKN